MKKLTIEIIKNGNEDCITLTNEGLNTIELIGALEYYKEKTLANRIIEHLEFERKIKNENSKTQD